MTASVAPARLLHLFALFAAVDAAGSVACVSQVTFDRAAADAAKAQADADGRQKDDAARIQALEQKLAAAEAETQDRDAKLNELSTATHNLQAQLDESTAINQQLRGELERLGKDVDKVLAERGTLSKALDDARSRLDELRKAQAAAESRTQLLRDLQRRFQPLVDAGQLRIEAHGARLVFTVKGDLLFDAGRADVRSAGKGTLMEIAHALGAAASPAGVRKILVTASVDDEPLKSKRFDSTWDLTAARAVAVVKLLVSLGVPAASLAAAGAGSFDTIAPNDGADGRARNRRVEIALLPVDEPPATQAVK
jgi:chemotaxis protein MotB